MFFAEALKCISESVQIIDINNVNWFYLKLYSCCRPWHSRSLLQSLVMGWHMNKGGGGSGKADAVVEAPEVSIREVVTRP